MEQKFLCVKINYETFKIVQARYRRKFHFNTFVNESQIFKTIKNFEVHGTSEDRMAMGSSSSGLPSNLAGRIQQYLQLNA